MDGSLYQASLPTGQLLQLKIGSVAGFSYYVYLPKRGAGGAPIFVSVHGISGNAREHAESFVELAERYGVVLLAPHFKFPEFRDYQRLGRNGRGSRADLVLRAAVREIASLTGARSDGIYLFGFSGGGQFVHRYAMAYPRDVAAYVVGAAGWYTFPQEQVKFPRGLLNSNERIGVEFDLRELLRVRGAVMVGERDTRQGRSLNKSAVIALHQGANRFERGLRWVNAMNAAATKYHLSPHFEFFALPKCRHSFSRSMKRNMGLRVAEWLFRDLPQPASSVPEEPLEYGVAHFARIHAGRE